MPSIKGVPASAARIYIDEFELTQQSSGAEFNATLDEITYPIMGDSAAHHQVTAPNFSIPHRGYYTGRGIADGLGYFEDTLQARLGTTDPVTVTLVLGPVAYTMFGTWGTQLTIDAPVDGVITIEGNWASPDNVRRGAMIPGEVFADNGLGIPVDLGAASVADAAVFHASGFADLTAGAENVTVILQTSATEAGTYVTWLSHEFKIPGAAIESGVPNPNRWVRVLVELTAGVPGPVNAAASVLYE